MSIYMSEAPLLLHLFKILWLKRLDWNGHHIETDTNLPVLVPDLQSTVRTLLIPQLSFSGKQIAIKIYANLGLA